MTATRSGWHRLARGETCPHLRRNQMKHGHCVGVHHGIAKRSPTYKSWSAMLERCNRTAHPAYSEYGGRGISVCAEWETFANFLRDMGHRPEGMTLDRKDTNGNYEPGNCRWATRKQQSRNRRNNHLVTFQGRTQCLTEWANETGIKKQTIRMRLSKGWPACRALTA